MPRTRAPLSLLLLLPSPLALGAHDAIACGGFFCSTIPVDQTAEKIAFVVDHQQGTAEAIIQISFQGAAEEFAWVLPLTTAPRDVQVATGRSFMGLDQLTLPAFRVSWDVGPSCRFSPGGSGRVDASTPFDASGGPDGGGVMVLRQATVGPYDTAVISSTDPEAIRSWLTTNGYRVTPEMMEVVVPYVAQGDVLMALKLHQGLGVGALQPLALTLDTTEACVPLRMTAIAAIQDMEVVAYVLSTRGRAIPSNYLHVELNWARLDWLTGNGTYRALLNEAFDEAGGNAFVTEYAGSAAGLAGTVYRQGEYDLQSLRAATEVQTALERVRDQLLSARPEVAGILREVITDALLREHGVDPAAYWACAPSCMQEQARQIPLDGALLADPIEARVLAPDRRVQAAFDAPGLKLTRLRTFISPAEMNLDPIFDFRPELPDVSNVHAAVIHARCGGDGLPVGGLVQVELPDGMTLDVDFRTGRSAASDSPAALQIANLANGTVVTDNRPRLMETLGRAERGDGCSCEVAANADLACAGVLLLLLLTAARLGRRA